MSDLRTSSGRFANFLKASEHWGPDLLLGRFVAGLPDTVIAVGDMRDTYAELTRMHAELAAATARAEQAEAEVDTYRSQLVQWAEIKQAIHDVREMRERAARTEAAEVELEQLRARIAELGEVREEWGLAPHGFEPDQCRSTGHDEYGRVEARLQQQQYHRVTHRLVGQWREADDVRHDGAGDGEGEGT